VPLNKPEDFEILNRAHQYVDERCVHPADHVVQPQEALGRVGLTPLDIDIVLITSMSSYATGNIEMFINAQICMSKRGWLNIMAGDEMKVYNPRVFFPRDTMVYLVTEGWPKVHLVEDEEEVLPGVTFWWAGCHHRGSMGVTAETAKGRISFADPAFVWENIQDNRPPGCIENLTEWHAVYMRLKTADIPIPFHDCRLLDEYLDGMIA